MPRLSREVLCGKFFHVMVQGIAKENIFEKNEYKKKYKEILIKKTKEHDITIIAFCIMNNHTHILIHVDDMDSMSKCMQKINTSYARFYNKAESRVGFVFRDRYNTQPIKDERHLMTCIAYIHQNPVKAGIVKCKEDYQYSSYNEYINKIKRETITNKAIELAFYTTDNYQFRQTFESIHKVSLDSTEILDIQNTTNYIEFVNECIKRNMQKEQIVIELYVKYKLSTRNIAELLNITRYKVRKTLDNIG